MIELFQLMPTGETICLGATALAEVQAAQVVEDYPAADYNIFYAKRVLEPVEGDLP
jgi:uncharacterized sporulation protein YeaH/YhbH (DUF444 family)